MRCTKIENVNLYYSRPSTQAFFSAINLSIYNRPYIIPQRFVGFNSTYTSLSSTKGRDNTVGKNFTQASNLAKSSHGHEGFFKCVQLRLFMGGGIDSELAKVLPLERQVYACHICRHNLTACGSRDWHRELLILPEVLLQKLTLESAAY